MKIQPLKDYKVNYPSAKPKNKGAIAATVALSAAMLATSISGCTSAPKEKIRMTPAPTSDVEPTAGVALSGDITVTEGIVPIDETEVPMTPGEPLVEDTPDNKVYTLGEMAIDDGNDETLPVVTPAPDEPMDDKEDKQG